MRYRNTVTGAIVDVNSIVHGNWERIEDVAPVSITKEETPKAKPKKTTKRGNKTNE